jgi:hypothetical protein
MVVVLLAGLFWRIFILSARSFLVFFLLIWKADCRRGEADSWSFGREGDFDFHGELCVLKEVNGIFLILSRCKRVSRWSRDSSRQVPSSHWTRIFPFSSFLAVGRQGIMTKETYHFYSPRQLKNPSHKSLKLSNLCFTDPYGVACSRVL